MINSLRNFRIFLQSGRLSQQDNWRLRKIPPFSGKALIMINFAFLPSRRDSPSGLLQIALLLFLYVVAIDCNYSMAESVTVLAPDRPTVDERRSIPANRKSPQLSEEYPEIDILVALTRPYEYEGLDMDMPKSLAQIYYPPSSFAGEEVEPERRDLLGDMEELRYLDKKSWGVNVALEKPGLYQFLLEAKPFWDTESGMFKEHSAKVLVPVLGEYRGWDIPGGQNFEIIPLTRPFGLTEPCLFKAQALLSGKPAPDINVRMGWINDARINFPSVWQHSLEAKTDANGYFSFILTRPGWWYCEASVAGKPLKGPDGEMKPSEMAAILWMYVENAPGRSH